MEKYALTLIEKYGYVGMFLGMILEAVIIIIPSELILATGGILAGRKTFTFIGAFLTGLIGSIFCAIILYLMGYIGGTPFINKFGKYFFIKNKDLDKANIWYRKYGLFGSMVGRNLPIIRTLISIPIGIMHLPFSKFIVYTTVGSIPWTFAFVYVGYSLGNNWTVVNTYINRLKVPIKILIILLILTYMYKLIKKLLNKNIK